MKPAHFEYHGPTTLEEAISVLGSAEDAKVLAGGQSLMPMLNLRFVQPSHVVDLNRIAALAGIEATDGGIRIGAMTRQKALAASPLLAERMPVFADALRWVGHFQTRTRGTLGGSLCHLDPAAELPMIAALYGARMIVKGPAGERVVPFAEWPLAYMMPTLAPDEILTAVVFPAFGGRHGHGFHEFARRHGDFAIVAAAALVALDDGGAIARASIAIGGADQVVRSLDNVAASLAGQPADEDTFRAAAAAAAEAIDAFDDAYVSAAYRSRLVGILTRRALADAAARARGAGVH